MKKSIKKPGKIAEATGAATKTIKAEAASTTIVSATGTSHAGEKGLMSSRIEKAMSDAVMEAIKNGITDPDHQRALKLAARERVKKEAAEEQAKFLADSDKLDKRT